MPTNKAITRFTTYSAHLILNVGEMIDYVKLERTYVMYVKGRTYVTTLQGLYCLSAAYFSHDWRWCCRALLNRFRDISMTKTSPDISTTYTAIQRCTFEMSAQVKQDICNCYLVDVEFICLSVCLSVCLPACLPACLPVCLSVCLSVCPSVRPSFRFCLHAHSSVCRKEGIQPTS